MTLQNFGYILVVIGGRLFLGGGGGVRGFRGYKVLLNEYWTARAEGKPPTGDQQFAYWTLLCNIIGIPLLVAGLLLLLLSTALASSHA
jgi:hypothetical protein